MITVPIEYILIILIIIVIFLAIWIDSFIITPFKYYILRKRLYKYTKIPSHGELIVKTKWCKSDEKALSYYGLYEFVECIYPKKHKKIIKPKIFSSINCR